MRGGTSRVTTGGGRHARRGISRAGRLEAVAEAAVASVEGTLCVGGARSLEVSAKGLQHGVGRVAACTTGALGWLGRVALLAERDGTGRGGRCGGRSTGGGRGGGGLQNVATVNEDALLAGRVLVSWVAAVTSLRIVGAWCSACRGAGSCWCGGRHRRRTQRQAVAETVIAGVEGTLCVGLARRLEVSADGLQHGIDSVAICPGSARSATGGTVLSDGDLGLCR